MIFHEWMMHKSGDLTERRIKFINKTIEKLKIATDTPISEGESHIFSKIYAEEGQAKSQCILDEMEYVEKAINGDNKARDALEKEYKEEACIRT